MARAIVMGDPSHFAVLGGANPHTRNLLGLRKRVDPERAQEQWHALAHALTARGVEVYVIAPHARLPGLVYPANAGFIYPLSLEQDGSEAAAGRNKTVFLSNLIKSRAGEREVYREFLRAAGFETREVQARFEGEADFFPAGPRMIFTYGRIERQRFVPRLGLPPWRRIYGFRSEHAALMELKRVVGKKPILDLELCQEAYYHGDTVLCSFGPRREFLLAYLGGLTAEAQARLSSAFEGNLVELSDRDAALYAANSFQVETGGKLCLFAPRGISEELLRAIRERSVEPVQVDVSEFLAKGGGSVKCMILDLGPAHELPASATARDFRARRLYSNLFPTPHAH